MESGKQVRILKDRYKIVKYSLKIKPSLENMTFSGECMMGMEVLEHDLACLTLHMEGLTVHEI